MRFLIGLNVSHPLTAGYYVKFLLTCDYVESPYALRGRAGLGLGWALLVAFLVGGSGLALITRIIPAGGTTVGPLFTAAMVFVVPALAYHMGPRCFLITPYAPYPLWPERLPSDLYIAARFFDHNESSLEDRWDALATRRDVSEVFSNPIPVGFQRTLETYVDFQSCHAEYGFGMLGATEVVALLRRIWPLLPAQLATSELVPFRYARLFPELVSGTGAAGDGWPQLLRGSSKPSPLERMQLAADIPAYNQCSWLMLPQLGMLVLILMVARLFLPRIITASIYALATLTQVAGNKLVLGVARAQGISNRLTIPHGRIYRRRSRRHLRTD